MEDRRPEPDKLPHAHADDDLREALELASRVTRRLSDCEHAHAAAPASGTRPS